MREFSSLTSVAAPIPDADVDTDVIFPARFLLLTDKKGLGKHLFHERRHNATNSEPFIIDQAPYDKAEILVTGPRFGVGSSREQAVWALADFGIRCVIAPSFGEIFFANCFKNGILPIVLGGAIHNAVMQLAHDGQPLTVDLERQCITTPDGKNIAFDVDPHRRRALMLGLDETGAILADDADDIAAFEHQQKQTAPWLYLTNEQLSTFARSDADNNEK